MKYDFNKILKGLDKEILTNPIFDGVRIIKCNCGNILEQPKVIGNEKLTVAIISRMVLLNPGEDELNLTGEIKLERGMLAMRIKESEVKKDKIELDATEAGKLRELIGKKVTKPLIMIQCWNVLDQKDN